MAELASVLSRGVRHVVAPPSAVWRHGQGRAGLSTATPFASRVRGFRYRLAPLPSLLFFPPPFPPPSPPSRHLRGAQVVFSVFRIMESSRTTRYPDDLMFDMEAFKEQVGEGEEPTTEASVREQGLGCSSTFPTHRPHRITPFTRVSTLASSRHHPQKVETLQLRGQDGSRAQTFEFSEQVGGGAGI
jgi:hypothetical protein